MDRNFCLLFSPSLLPIALRRPRKAQNGRLIKDGPMRCEELGGWRKKRESNAKLGSILFPGCVLLKQLPLLLLAGPVRQSHS